MNPILYLAERRKIPDYFIRIGIRRRLALLLKVLEKEKVSTRKPINALANGPIAEAVDAANRQHYEVPTDYFRNVLGPHLKYSCGHWPEGCRSLEQAEAEMLRLTCERALLESGQRILELGCGWGSLSLWMAEHYPETTITAVSNSRSQREYIEAQARNRKLENLEIITCDINDFQPGQSYDRIVSVEMFEHIRNHRRLFARIERWLEPAGKLFIHVFVHRKHSYSFDASNPREWMARHFFTGGRMPSVEWLPQAATGLLNEESRWQINGRHYSRTLEAWLRRQDTAETTVADIFKSCYGQRRAKLWIQRWRMFYITCSELFAYQGGTEWFVTHYRFGKTA